MWLSKQISKSYSGFSIVTGTFIHSPEIEIGIGGECKKFSQYNCSLQPIVDTWVGWKENGKTF